MQKLSKKTDIISRLRQDILHMEGYKAPSSNETCSFGLGLIESVFPHKVFPTAAIHDFLCGKDNQASACCGFLSGILKQLMINGGVTIWIGRNRSVFPPALKYFGIDPGHVIFIDLEWEKDILWVFEESLKSPGVAAVIGEIGNITFSQSRRLQLAVETSRVTGFILRNDNETISPTASTARWRIKPLPSVLEDGMPGVGFPRWHVELLKVKNGNPGAWNVEWSGNEFRILSSQLERSFGAFKNRKVG